MKNGVYEEGCKDYVAKRTCRAYACSFLGILLNSHVLSQPATDYNTWVYTENLVSTSAVDVTHVLRRLFTPNNYTAIFNRNGLYEITQRRISAIYTSEEFLIE
jgi:hypothetical protein